MEIRWGPRPVLLRAVRGSGGAPGLTGRPVLLANEVVVTLVRRLPLRPSGPRRRQGVASDPPHMSCPPPKDPASPGPPRVHVST